MSSLEPAPKPTPRWRYVVPNAITCCGLMIGLTACFRAIDGGQAADYVDSAWLIVLCVLIDKLDGSAARLLKATSKIGLQLDSFSDFVTFGIAPATLLYTMISRDPTTFAAWHGPWAIWMLKAVTATYVLCACIRLAKFNVLPEDAGGGKFFWGVPTTLAGGLMATLVLLAFKYEGVWLIVWMPWVALALGLMMVSSVPLPKVAKQEAHVFNVMLVLGVAVSYVCGLLRVYPEVLVTVLAGYFLWAIPWTTKRWRSLRRPNLDPYPTD